MMDLSQLGLCSITLHYITPLKTADHTPHSQEIIRALQLSPAGVEVQQTQLVSFSVRTVYNPFFL